MTTVTSPHEIIEIYWMPGCSSCLRLKEFVEGTGLPFTAINVEAEPARAGKLRERGMRVPALCVGEECVNGVHLSTVAGLLGVDYAEPERLSPAELRDKYRIAIGALTRFTAQITPETAAFALPGRERSLIEVAGHAACVMRYFLGKYDDDDYGLFFDDLEPSARDSPEIIAFAGESLDRFEAWWAEMGSEDPLDTVVPVYWGHRTLHEALEREVWHTMQHTRQVMFMLEQVGVSPDAPLTADDLAGLPLPVRVFD
jgi:glutaredoxin